MLDKSLELKHGVHNIVSDYLNHLSEKYKHTFTQVDKDNMQALLDYLAEFLDEQSQSVSTANTAHDPVNHPSHYKMGKVQCIEAIKSSLTEEEFRGYCKGNVIKYTWRERYKAGRESLEKAKWYLTYLLDKV